jgi:hypothetical protein
MEGGRWGERAGLRRRQARASGRIELGITLFEDSLVLPDDVKPPALLVSLRHQGS